jgi:hypothetical protein
VAIFLTWLTTRDIEDAEVLVPKIKQDPHEYEYDKRFDQLVKCWTLGDFTQAPEFQNAILDSILSYWQPHLRAREAYLSGEVVALVYRNTKAGSPLRRLIVDCALDAFLAKLCPLTYDSAYGGYTDGFYEDFGAPSRGDSCDYHIHPEKHDGYSCTKISNI